MSDALIYRVKVLHSSETEMCICDQNIEIFENDIVVIPTKYGNDLGRVLGMVKEAQNNNGDDMSGIIRKATDDDKELFEKNKEKEREAIEICREKVASRRLDMKLVSAHYIPEESKVLFFFTAENRVDFRELVKDLVAVFKMRIELRQIGVRDESRVLGGMGVCGRAYCCHGVTDKLKPVSIKMAKEQNLSLNSMKISGPCGRLLCCLSYEYDLYREAKKNLPNVGNRVRYQGEQCKIADVNILTRNVKIVDNDGRYIELEASAFQFNQKEKIWYVQ